MAALGWKAAVASSNVSARASSAGALGMLYTRHMDTSAAISAAKYLILRPPHYSRTVALARLMARCSSVRESRKGVPMLRVSARYPMHVSA